MRADMPGTFPRELLNVTDLMPPCILLETHSPYP